MAKGALRYLFAFGGSGAVPLLRWGLGDSTLADFAARWARKQPERIALCLGPARLTYGELDRRVAEAAGFLWALGARAGDTVALIGRNSMPYVALLLAGARSGVTLSLVHPELGAQPLLHALAVSGARAIACERELASALSRHSALPLAAYELEGERWFGAVTPRRGFDGKRSTRDFAQVFTSGTTGLPKACRLPHSRVLAAACLFGAPLFAAAARGPILCPLPLFHGSPLLLGLGSALVLGVPLVLERKFSVHGFWVRAADSGATALLYVGDLGRMLLAAPASAEERQHRIRVAVGNGLAAELWSDFRARFGIEQVREFYASTESPVGIFNLEGRRGSVGNLPYAWMFGLRLLRTDPETGEPERDAQGRLCEAAPGEAGELVVRARRRGLGVYHGYVDRSETEARLLRNAFAAGDAYFRTFDRLRRDRDGFFYFVERTGQSYRFRGENVAMAEVERELARAPHVADVQVTSLALPGHDGKAGVALLVVTAGFSLGDVESVFERLPRSAWPRLLQLVPELARTESLKRRHSTFELSDFEPGSRAAPAWLLQPRAAGPASPPVASVAAFAYVELDAALYEALARGRLRL